MFYKNVYYRLLLQNGASTNKILPEVHWDHRSIVILLSLVAICDKNLFYASIMHLLLEKDDSVTFDSPVVYVNSLRNIKWAYFKFDKRFPNLKLLILICEILKVKSTESQKIFAWLSQNDFVTEHWFTQPQFNNSGQHDISAVYTFLHWNIH